VVPGLPHHITQRGNRRQKTFFCDEDYQSYLELMAHWCDACGVMIWGYCLMPNHIHLIALPKTADGLRRGIGEAHRRYTRRVNFRQGWRGHLWQGRFASFVMDESYLLAAARYVELNPVRARLVQSPGAYRWSSASAHLKGRDDILVKAAPLLELMPDWHAFLKSRPTPDEMTALRRHESSGRPLGSDSFLRGVEKRLGRLLHKLKPGPKPKKKR